MNAAARCPDHRPIARFAPRALALAVGLLMMLGTSPFGAVAQADPPTPSSGPAAGGTTVTGVVPPLVFSAVTGGNFTGYGLDQHGQVWAWGANDVGQLGDGTREPRGQPGPVDMSALPQDTRFVAIAAGYSSAYALDQSGQIWAWGGNEACQIGDGRYGDGRVGYGPVNDALTPSRVAGSVTFTAVAAAKESGYGLDTDGNIWTWGWGPWVAGLMEAITLSNVPVKIRAALPSGARFTSIFASASDENVFAYDSEGNLWAWGRNVEGQLGIGHAAPSEIHAGPAMVKVPAGVQFKQIESMEMTLALDTSGVLWAWGSNGQFGRLGDGTAKRQLSPVRVDTSKMPAGTVFKSIAAFSGTSFALTQDGHVWGWGYNTLGTFFPGVEDQVTPVLLDTPVAQSLSAGVAALYGMDSDGSLWAWGSPGLGEDVHQLITVPSPVDLSTPAATFTKVTSVDFGGTPGTGLSQSGSSWTVTTDAGCGPVDVTVYYAMNGQEGVENYPAGFTFGAPPAITQQPGDASLFPGSTYAPDLTVTGDPAPDIAWQSSKDGQTWVDAGTGAAPTGRHWFGTTYYRASVTNCWSTLAYKSENNTNSLTAITDVVTVTVGWYWWAGAGAVVALLVGLIVLLTVRRRPATVSRSDQQPHHRDNSAPQPGETQHARRGY